jgi:hypothetical protein
MVGFLIIVRWWLGSIIGKAAERLGCGYLGWLICSVLFGPLIVWIVYLIFVHWRPRPDEKVPDEKPMEVSAEKLESLKKTIRLETDL